MDDKNFERVNPDVYREVLTHFGYDGWTEISASGMWKGVQEDNLIIELFVPKRIYSINQIARKLADGGNQTSVLWSREQIEAVFTESTETAETYAVKGV